MKKTRTEEDERLFFWRLGLSASVNFGSAHSLGELEEDDEELSPKGGRGRSLCPQSSDCLAFRYEFACGGKVVIAADGSEDQHGCLPCVAVFVFADEVLQDLVAGLTVDDHTNAGH